MESFLGNLSVKELLKSVYICRSYGQKSRVLFFATQCIHTCADLLVTVSGGCDERTRLVPLGTRDVLIPTVETSIRISANNHLTAETGRIETRNSRS